jgi:hypothetical protein
MRIGKRNPKIMLIGTGVAALVGGIDCLQNNLMVIAVAGFLVAVLNIGASVFIKRYPFFIHIFLLSINAVFAALSSYVYFLEGRDKIQYGWAAVVIISVIAIIHAFLKRKKMNQVKQNSDTKN